ncbi:hypothetical protein CERSUDRAFT_114243 [Gelatoporia subvermispora B]|uniref:Glycosyltransferase 61 catalytic domain-containing protein n=1 Tax=Ceriporiopsis subvermispora (strain B) TaxID=914234 RepID=M2PMH5_CERS8|nr:hypothetical protein CERSUDRAFT_114243 [Gelatoporia subvermispora B]
MVVSRTRSLRDVILILLGAMCMHLTSSFLWSSDHVPESIIVKTSVNSHFIHDDYDSSDIVLPPAEVLRPAVPVVEPQRLAAERNVQEQVPLPPAEPEKIDVAYELPETTIVSHAPGWTLFRNLYMSNGTLFIVTSEPRSSFPDIRLITSTGLAAENTPENIAAREPTAENMDFLTPAQARARWGGSPDRWERNRVWSVEGNTYLFNDPPQFLDHYYHFCAELFFGAWAFWQGAFNAVVDPANAALTTAPPVHRAIFAHADATGWRDRPGFNAYFLRSAFPSLTVEVEEDWLDRVIVTSATGEHARAFHFDTVLFTDRSAAFRGVLCGSQNQRTAAEAYTYMMGEGRLAKWWWEPLRRAVLRFAGVDEAELDIGVRADKVVAAQNALPGSGVQVDRVRPNPLLNSQDVVVTYISRQGARRHLIDEDHAALVLALTEMCASKGWELNVVQAERLSKEEQLSLAARTTIMLGVHGNGLTHLIMMPVTPISAVIEIFYPGGFAHDYEWTTRALGMRHFGVWNDTYNTYPVVPDVAYPEGFQGTQIPVYPPTVVRIIEDRIAGRLPGH